MQENTRLDEIAQAKIRNYLHLVLVILTFLAYRNSEGISFVGVAAVSIASIVSASVLYLWAYGIKLGRVTGRYRIAQRLCGIVSDNFFITAVLILGGESTIGIWALYIWIAIGYGVRYGVSYLYANLVVSLIAFSAVFQFVLFWRENAAFSFGLALSMLVVPIYVGWLIKQLHEAVDERERAYAAKSEFTARMSHELRTPLHAIISTADILRTRVKNLEEGELVNLIAVSSGTLLDLINRVLDLSKFESGRSSSIGDVTNLYKVIGDSYKISLPQATKKHLDFRLLISLDIPSFVISSEDELKEILVNILGNALKFTDEGLIELSVELVSETTSEAIVLFRITDTGIGIASDKLETIFEPYAQADTSPTRSHGGTGLGISFTRELVRHMGGNISVTSEVALGSVFSVRIPFAKCFEENQKNHRGNVIVISEDDAFAATASDHIRRENLTDIRTRSFSEAQQALRRVHHDDLSVGIIIDASCFATKLSREVPKLLRENPYALLPILGVGTPDFKAEATTSGCIAYMGYEEFETKVGKWTLLINSMTNPRLELNQDDLVKPTATGALKILIADDDATNRRILTMILENEGHAVTAVADGETALYELCGQRFDVAILDMHMPRRDGIEVIKVFRFSSYDTENDTAMLLFTADSTQAAREHALKSGVDRFVTKPIRPNALLSTIYSVVGAKRGVQIDGETSTESAPIIRAPIIRLTERAGSSTESFIDDEIVADLLTFMDKSEQIQFFSEFREDAEQYVDSYASARDAEQVVTAQENMHALAGAAATIGALKLAEIAREIENVDPMRASSEKEAFVNKLHHVLRNTVSEVERRFLS